MTFTGSSASGVFEFVTGAGNLVPPGSVITGTLTGCTLELSGTNGTLTGSLTGVLSAAGTEFAGTFANTLPSNGTWRMGLVTDSATTVGTSVATAGGTSSADPIGTGVVSPDAGTIVIDEAISTGGSFASYSLFDTVVRIEAPTASVSAPLELTFTLDPAATGGTAAAVVAVFRNGTQVSDCTGAPQAIPNPCVSLREDLVGGGVRLTVLTSQASTWNFGAVPPVAPGAPTLASAVAGNAEATVSWSAPASNGGSPVTGYVVTPYIGYFPLAPQTFNSTATSQVVTGLLNATTYRFRAQAINTVGTGSYSTVTNAVTPVGPTKPSAPTIGTAVAGTGQATVSWTAPTSDGGSPITWYVVTPYIGYFPLPSQWFNSTATTQTVSPLPTGVSVRFRVRALNAYGTSAYSRTTNPVTPA